MSLQGRAAIVGVAESDLGEVGPGLTPLDLIGQATTRALEDAGLEKNEVDGLFSASAYYHMPTLSVGEYLGIRPRYSDATNVGGSSRSEEHTSELQSRQYLVCRLLLEKKKQNFNFKATLSTNCIQL